MPRLNRFHLVAIAVTLFLFPTFLVAQPTVVELPRAFADFAINPDTGDICGVDHAKDKVLIFPSDFLDGDKQEIGEPIRVGSTPVGVTYKKFGEDAYFVVCCTQDSHVYVINATTHELVSKVAVAQAGVSSITNSTNPEDPFVYYCYGGGHDSMTGAIDLREMVDRGKAFDDSMDCAISADGTLAYRRGPWSPSGFESLQLTSSFEDPKPTFIRLFYDHNSTYQYIPGPFGALTAAGKTIYSSDLKKKVATTDNFPVAFLKSKPFIVCSSGADRDDKGSLNLNVVSSNTFNKVGTNIDVGNTLQAKALPRGGPGHADFKRVATRMRYLIDEANERLYVAQNDRLIAVSINDFDLPDEVVMEIPDLKRQVLVGQEQTIDLSPTDENVTIEVDDLPDGASIEGNVITWTPTADQVGTEKISVRMTYKETEKQQVVLTSIRFPSISLPGIASDLSISPDGSEAVVYTSTSNQREMMRAMEGRQIAIKHTISLVDLGNREVTKTKTTPFAISSAAVDQHFVYIASAETNYCQIFDKADLKKVKTLYTENRVQKIETDGQQLVLNGKVFDLPGLTQSKTGSTTKDVLKQLWTVDFRGKLLNINRQDIALGSSTTEVVTLLRTWKCSERWEDGPTTSRARVLMSFRQESVDGEEVRIAGFQAEFTLAKTSTKSAWISSVR